MPFLGGYVSSLEGTMNTMNQTQTPSFFKTFANGGFSASYQSQEPATSTAFFQNLPRCHHITGIRQTLKLLAKKKTIDYIPRENLRLLSNSIWRCSMCSASYQDGFFQLLPTIDSHDLSSIIAHMIHSTHLSFLRILLIRKENRRVTLSCHTTWRNCHLVCSTVFSSFCKFDWSFINVLIEPTSTDANAKIFLSWGLHFFPFHGPSPSSAALIWWYNLKKCTLILFRIDHIWGEEVNLESLFIGRWSVLHTSKYENETWFKFATKRSRTSFKWYLAQISSTKTAKFQKYGKEQLSIHHCTCPPKHKAKPLSSVRFLDETFSLPEGKILRWRPSKN